MKTTIKTPIHAVLAVLVFLCSSYVSGVVAISSSLVFMSNGKLAYNKYANEGESNAVNTIPDFSFAGYKGGGVRIPNVASKRTISPVSGDNRKNIQDAIDFVSGLAPGSSGFRGAVSLNAGTYDVSSPIFIRASGVVLRGAGQGTNGTIIRFTATTQSDCLQIAGNSTERWNEVAGTRQKITDSYVPTGTRSFNLASASGYQVGDFIVVLRTPNSTWVKDLGMDKTGIEWDPADYQVGYERRIKSISGNKITIDIPIVQAMEDRYGGGSVFEYTTTGRINNVGVEDIRFDSTFASSTDENHGWSAISMKYVYDGWVRNVTAVHYGYACVHILDSVKRVTVQDSAMKDHVSQITGGRRYSFAIDGNSGMNLFQRLYTEDGRHDYVTGSRVPGPNVFLDSLAVATHDDVGPHHRFATGLLFDNIRCGLIRVRNRGTSGTGHGWSGAQTVFWNIDASKEIRVDSPRGSKNFGIGSKGSSQAGGGFWEAFGTPVTPRSLYLQQLEDRLGQSAVDNIAPSAQQSGTIWDQLANWKGEGKSPLAP